MNYKCIKAFSVPRMDEDGYPDEEHSFYVRKGSIWREPDEEEKGYIDNISEVVLVKDNGDYLNITKNLFKAHFEVVERMKTCCSADCPKTDSRIIGQLCEWWYPYGSKTKCGNMFNRWLKTEK